jgi:hypothetical protein
MIKITQCVLVPAILACLVLCGCGGSDPVNYSAPIALNLKAKSDDVVANAIRAEKGINTEIGNPFGAFITEARKQLGNVDPTRVEIDSVELLLAADSKGVTTLEQVFTGKVELLFEMGESKNSYPVAELTDPTGGAPVTFTKSFKYSDLAPQDLSPFLNGSFKVVIRGTAVAGFTVKGLEASLQITLTFNAYE